MSNRTHRANVAAETLEILKTGQYRLGADTIFIGDALARSCAGSVLYRPSELEELCCTASKTKHRRTVVSVRNCSSFAAATQLIAEGFDDPFCLNFASAKNPGGGFISGAQAQEEALARASGLYASLLLHSEYYEANRRCGTSLYTDHAIYSPQVPVFRDDADRLLPASYSVSFLTSPAVNAGAVRANEPENVPHIEARMRQRIEMVLAIAKEHGHRALVLGAWGCGVFANNPYDMARWFREALTENSAFADAFDQVVFAVFDQLRGAPIYLAFQQTLTELCPDGS